MRLLVATFILCPLLAFCQSMTTPGVGQLPQKFDTIAQLVSRPGTNYQTVLVRGYSTVGDWGPERQARFIPGTGASTNRGCDFATTGGRWHFPDCDSGVVMATWFGSVPDDGLDDTSYIQSSINYAESVSGVVEFPRGTFDVDSIYITNASLRGVGYTYNTIDGYSTKVRTALQHKIGATGHLLNIERSTGGNFVSGFDLLGHRELNLINPRPIISSSTRTNFVVATNHVPATPVNVGAFPYYGFAFFYSATSNYLGHALISSVDTNTGDIGIRYGWDNYATSAGILTASEFVCFSPLESATGYFTDRASPTAAGWAGINITRTVSQGIVCKLQDLKIIRFHTGVRVVAGSGIDYDNVWCQANTFAGIATAVPAFGSDDHGNRVYCQGFYAADVGNSDPAYGTWTDEYYRSTAFGLYAPSSRGVWLDFSSSRNVISILDSLSSDLYFGYILADVPIKHGWLTVNGRSGALDGGVDIGYLCVSTPYFTLPTGMVYENGVDRCAVGVVNNDSLVRRLSIRTLSVGRFAGSPAGNDFASAVSIPQWTATTNRVSIGAVVNKDGATNLVATGRAVNFSDPNWFITPAERKFGVLADQDTDDLLIAADGAANIRINSTSITSSNTLSIYRTDTSSQVGFNRTGSSSFGVLPSGENLLFRDDTKGLSAVSINSATTEVGLQLGELSGTPRTPVIYGTTASGTNVAATSMIVYGPRGTGNSTPAAIRFATSDVGASGTTAQTRTEKVRINSTTTTDETPLSILVNSSLSRVRSSNGVLNIGLTGGTAANFYRGDGKFTNTYVNVDGSSVTLPNFIDSAYITFTPSGSDIYATPVNSGVSAGTYSNPSITVDIKGRVTSISSGSSGDEVTVNGSATSNPNFKDGSNIAFGLSGSDVTADLTATGVGAGSYTAAGGSITVDAKGRVTAASSGLSGYTIVNSYIGAGPNISIDNSSGTNIVISATTGGSTNGTPLYVDAAGPLATANLANSTEIDPAASGTNVTFSIVASSIATNKIDSTFYGLLMAADTDTGTNILVNGTLVSMANLQDDTGAGGINWAVSGSNIKAYATNVAHGLNFTNGVTNSAGVVQWAVASGANITLTTNNGQITIAAATGVTNSGTGVSVDSGALLVYANLINSLEIDPSVSNTNVSFAISTFSVETNKLTTNAFLYFLNRANHLNTQPWSTIDSTPTTLGGYGILNAQLTNTTLTRFANIGAGTAGDILYRDVNGWTNLVKSTDGLVLKLSGGYPTWDTDETGTSDYISKSVSQVCISNTVDETVLYTWTVPGDTLISDGDELEIYVPAKYTTYSSQPSGYTWTFYKEYGTGTEGSVATLYSDSLNATVETFAADWTFRLKRMTSTNAMIILKHTVGANTGTNVLANSSRVMDTVLENGGWGVDTDFALTITHGVANAGHITLGKGYTVRKIR